MSASGSALSRGKYVKGVGVVPFSLKLDVLLLQSDGSFWPQTPFHPPPVAHSTKERNLNMCQQGTHGHQVNAEELCRGWYMPCFEPASVCWYKSIMVPLETEKTQAAVRSSIEPPHLAKILDTLQRLVAALLQPKYLILLFFMCRSTSSRADGGSLAPMIRGRHPPFLPFF